MAILYPNFFTDVIKSSAPTVNSSVENIASNSLVFNPFRNLLFELKIRYNLFFHSWHLW